jgi:two-component system, NarL family, sensor kinase
VDGDSGNHALSGDGDPSANDDADESERDAELSQLRRAERLILVIRWIVWAAWLPIHLGSAAGASAATWIVFVAVALYAAATHVLVLRAGDIRRTAIATTIGDACGVALMCFATGGITSDVYPYFYLHLLTTSIRFGIPETIGAFALDGALTIALLAAPGADAMRELALRLFYLAAIGTVAALLSRDARRHHRRSLEAAREARDQRRDVLRQLMRAEEEERKRLAGEIHDRMGRRIFELLHGIERCRERLAAANPAAAGELDRLTAEARACGDEIRDVMNQLRPPLIDDFGFVEVARDALASVDGDLRVSLRVDESAAISRPEVNVMLFRVLQEAVWNARKHANASRLEVEFGPDGPGRVRLVVRDDGDGFDTSGPPPRGHYGLLYMRERAEACGGALEIRSSPGHGTEVSVTVPAV